MARRPNFTRCRPVFAGLAANTLAGWWWLDGIVALVIAGWAVIEGRRTWAGRACTGACP
jgi:hypothetical protein